MKIFATALLFALLCISYLPTHAQFKLVAEGPKFEEPEEGFAKILQLKNGNTFYIHITAKDGINVRVYDASHKEKAVKTISPAYESLIIENRDAVRGIFEMNNDVLVFMYKEDKEDKLPRLHRLNFDGTSGNLKKQDIIAVGKYTWRNRPMLGSYTYFYVRKDPDSDNYALAMFDELTEDNTKRLEIVHYNSANSEISRKFCFLPNENEAKSFFNDMVVLGNEKICVLLKYTQKGAKRGTWINKEMMVIIEKGKAAVEFVKLDNPDDINSYYCTAKYNASTKKILYISAVTSSAIIKDGYDIKLYMIDPITKKAELVPEVGHSEKLNTTYKETLDQKENYQGMPQNILINEDGSFTILYEEMTDIGTQNGVSGTELGTIAVSEHDMNGKFVSDYLIPMAHWIPDYKQNPFPFYISKREMVPQLLSKNIQYKSFVFFKGIKKAYILFNDTYRNNDIINAKKEGRFGTETKSKIVRVMAITGNCSAFMFKLDGSDILPKRNYLFEEKKGAQSALALLTISDYNKKNNTYATLMLDKSNTKSKMVSVVWQQAD